MSVFYLRPLHQKPVADTLQLSVMVTVAPVGKLGILVPAGDCNEATKAAPVSTGQVAPPVALQLAVLQVNPVLAGSLTTVPPAGPGPTFVTTILY